MIRFTTNEARTTACTQMGRVVRFEFFYQVFCLIAFCKGSFPCPPVIMQPLLRSMNIYSNVWHTLT